MMSCIRCQTSSDDGYQRVTIGLCASCVHALASAMTIVHKTHPEDAHLVLDFAVDR